MAGFSAGIKFNSLDDYILPSQACVLPVEDDFSRGTVAINKKEFGVEAKKSVELSLADCLACSGCVTTAETMLVQEQSGEKLKTVISEKGNKLLIATVSSQSIASIAAHYSEEGPAAMIRIDSFLREKLSFDFVTDLAWAQTSTLQETLNELLSTSKENRPIVTSSCPGLVCLAEKSQPTLLPHLSKVQSAQQIAGRVFKEGFPDVLGDFGNIIHVSVQPCFDKKLEATRKEFTNPEGLRYTDMVLATTELLDLLIDNDDLLSNIKRSKIDIKFSSIIPRLPSATPSSSLVMYRNLEGSGSQCITAIANYFLSTHNVNITQEHICIKDGEQTAVTRPSEGIELHLSNKKPGAYEFAVIDSLTGKTLFRAAALYGFKHITNLVKTTRIKKVPDFKKYDFIELMACPDGCLNGGGQLRSTSHTNTDLLKIVTTAHDSIMLSDSNSQDGNTVKDIFNKSGGKPEDWFYTTFNNLTKEGGEKKQPTLAQLDW